MFNFGKNAKEKARQLKQTEKTAKRLLAKKQKAATVGILDKESTMIETKPFIAEGV